jgi:hypothetical protein
MNVVNVHERELPVPPATVGALLDGLASPTNVLWPRQTWPPMKFDRPLGAGARGGHGPIRYVVERHEPGRNVVFRFTGPRGFDGWHGLEVAIAAGGATVLRHRLEMTTRGPARLSWPLVFRPLHDALVEDALACAQAALGLPPEVRPWSTWVRFLRWAFSGGRARPQAKLAVP